MKIKAIVPLTELEDVFRRDIDKYADRDTIIDTQCVEYGTSSIESAYDEVLNAPGIIKLGEKAQEEGYDGVYIACVGDPSLDALREKLEIPVVGAGRTSMMYAAELGHKFSVVTILDNVFPYIERIARDLGVISKLAPSKAVDIPVLELVDDEKLLKALINKSVESITKDGADVIILGCTGMIDIDELLDKALKEMGYKVPVLSPTAVAIRYLQSLILLNKAQSKSAYKTPPEKERNIWSYLK